MNTDVREATGVPRPTLPSHFHPLEAYPVVKHGSGRGQGICSREVSRRPPANHFLTGFIRFVMPCVATVLLALGLFGCNDGGTEPKAVASVQVSPPSGSIYVGEVLPLAATARDAAGNVLDGRGITWASSNTSVATVSQEGLVTGVSAGDATITASAEGATGSASVTVMPVPVASVEVSPSSGSIEVGKTLQLTATVKGASGNVLYDRDVTWASSNTSVATASGTGLVEGVGPGSATITATCEGRSGTASVTVTVVPSAVISLGGAHTCSVTAEGEAYCWGRGEDGRLGNGSGTDKWLPTPVLGGLTFASVSTGHWHTCGVTTEGEAYCWGDGYAGMLGNGTTDDQYVPALVSGGLSFASVSVGDLYSCGLTTTGDAYCWGSGNLDALGNGSTQDRHVPTLVSGGLTFVLVTAGEAFHSCGLTTSGEAYCWGAGTWGNLGDGSAFPHRQPVPLLVTGGLTFATVDAGYMHTCGVTTEGDAYCWGDGEYGALGTGAEDDLSVPTSVSGGLTFVSLDAGNHGTCGVTKTGEAYCWGAGWCGRLGNGSEDHKYVPTPVSGG